MFESYLSDSYIAYGFWILWATEQQTKLKSAVAKAYDYILKNWKIFQPCVVWRRNFNESLITV